MDTYTYYDSDGRIASVVTCTEWDRMDSAYPGLFKVHGAYDANTHYISDTATQTVAMRPESPITLSGTVLSNVPLGAVLYVDGRQYDLSPGDNTLKFDLPGTYLLRIECFPYLDWFGEVVV